MTHCDDEDEDDTPKAQPAEDPRWNPPVPKPVWRNDPWDPPREKGKGK